MDLVILFVVFSAYVVPQTALSGGFLIGIIQDLWYGYPLGYSSLWFIAVATGVNLYKRKFNAATFWFLVPASVIFLYIKNALGGQSIHDLLSQTGTFLWHAGVLVIASLGMMY